MATDIVPYAENRSGQPLETGAASGSSIRYSRSRCNPSEILVFSYLPQILALMATADEGAAPPAPVPPCGNPTCPFPDQAVRLQQIPEGFAGDVRPGATFFYRKKAACAGTVPAPSTKVAGTSTTPPLAPTVQGSGPDRWGTSCEYTDWPGASNLILTQLTRQCG